MAGDCAFLQKKKDNSELWKVYALVYIFSQDSIAVAKLKSVMNLYHADSLQNELTPWCWQ